MSSLQEGFVVEIEQNLLGIMLKGGDQRAVLTRLEPQHFIEPIHAEIYRTMQLTHEPQFHRGFAEALLPRNSEERLQIMNLVVCHW